ncbi:MAG TPA: hypothetical protein DIU07_14260 [Rhodobacteraceae bacterium]|nr:hypothetical protein [Paracoccaceae bacterium]
MILYFVLVGFVTGAIGAGFVLYSGGSVLLAVLAYSLAGALGVVLSALIIAFAPSFPRPRPRRGLPAGAQPVRARSTLRARPVRARPMRARHARVEAQAPRR